MSAQTVNLRRESQAVRREQAALVFDWELREADERRPKTRADCVDGPRPCPWVSCRYNLFLDVLQSSSLKLNFPDLEPHELGTSCALDVADAGGATLERVGDALNMTRERVRQVEEKIFKRLRDVGAINEDGEAARAPRLQVDQKKTDAQPRPDVAKREILVHLRRKDVVRVEEPKEYGQGEAQQDGEKRDEPHCEGEGGRGEEAATQRDPVALRGRAAPEDGSAPTGKGRVMAMRQRRSTEHGKFCYFCGKAGSSVRFYLEKGPYPGTKAVPYGKPSIVPAHSHCVPDPCAATARVGLEPLRVDPTSATP